MKRAAALLLSLTLVLVLSVAVVRQVAPAAPSGPVYTVAHVTAGIAAHPKAWVGRTVLVRGTVGAMMTLPSGGAVAPPLMLSDATHTLLIVESPSSAHIAGGQVFVAGPQLWVWPDVNLPHRPMHRLYHLPIIAQAIATIVLNVDRLDTAHLFRLRILPTRQTACPPNVCVAALLEEARP